jgi:hypothetical protein
VQPTEDQACPLRQNGFPHHRLLLPSTVAENPDISSKQLGSKSAAFIR